MRFLGSGGLLVRSDQPVLDVLCRSGPSPQQSAVLLLVHLTSLAVLLEGQNCQLGLLKSGQSLSTLELGLVLLDSGLMANEVRDSAERTRRT
jgi:hypothetical protein